MIRFPDRQMKTMTLRDFLRELAHPAVSTSTLIALVSFVLLLSLAHAAGFLGIWLAVIVVPAFLRYLTMIAEARARGGEAETPGVEFFTLGGSLWTLYPVVPIVLMAFLVRETGELFGDLPATVVALSFAALLPAMVGVLVITHSPLQSVDPRAIDRFIRGCGKHYWYAPATAVLIVLVPTLLGVAPVWVQIIVEVYLLAAFFAVIGAVTRQANLFDEIEIYDAVQPDMEKVRADLESKRITVVNHAYGFASRGNRDGALKHLYDWLAGDPDPDAAWPWFLDQLLRWDDTDPGLLLAQQYLGRLLEFGNQVAAVKLMLRCRMLNDRFRPLSPDLPAAIEAASACGNDELVVALSD
jgi:hypothetical protein